MTTERPPTASDVSAFVEKARRAGIVLDEQADGLEPLMGEELAAALEATRQTATRSAGYRGRMGLGLLYPALVAVLASIGVVAMSGVLGPVYDGMYRQVHEQPGPATARLTLIQNTAPVWLVVVPAAVVAGAWWLRREPRAWSLGPARPPKPLAAWAAASGDPADVRAVESLYASLSREGADRWTLYGPLGATVIVGGGATLLYALMLFTPLVELLGRLSP